MDKKNLFTFEEYKSVNKDKNIIDYMSFLFYLNHIPIDLSLSFDKLYNPEFIVIDDRLYKYEIVEVTKREAILELVSHDSSIKEGSSTFHLLWCLIDPKTIEKSLPYLNQIGVNKITFVYCDRTQKNFKVDIVKFQKIVINSSQQSGRISLMKFEILDSIDEVLEKYSSFSVLDFGGTSCASSLYSTVLVGCEGGFSEGERKSLAKKSKISFKTDLILKSETAAIVIASKNLI